MSWTTTKTRLLHALAGADDGTAWLELCRTYEPALRGFARHAGLPPAEVDDVVQEVLLALVRHFRAGDYDRSKGRLRVWIRAIALNQVRRVRRRLRHCARQSGGATGSYVADKADERALSESFDRTWERQVLRLALRQVRREVEPQTYRAFWLYAVKGRPAAEVAVTLGLARETVYVCKSRVLRRLREAEQRLHADG